MADRSSYRAIAERMIAVESNSLRPGVDTWDRGRVPSGRHSVHAYIEGDDVTLCGARIGPLIPWGDAQFGNVNGLMRCDECRALFDDMPED